MERKREGSPEIIDVEYEVLEGKPRGKVLDVERVEADVPGKPGPTPDQVEDFVREISKTPLVKTVLIGFAAWKVARALRSGSGRKRKKRNGRKIRKQLRRYRRRL